MYSLKVSYDCGTTYSLERQVEDPCELDARCDELDAQSLRWTIEDEDGRPAHRACAIYRGICALMAWLNS